MKKNIIFSMLMIIGLFLLASCATVQTWPDHERSAENKMVTIQEKIGDGLKTGAITPDQSQMYLTTLKGIRADYTALRNKSVPREDWNKIHVRLEVLEQEISTAIARTTKIEAPENGYRIITLQRRIDDGRFNGYLPVNEEREFQARLDSIRRDHLRITEYGRPITLEEKTDISRRLDSLATDLNKFR
jgi:hypothetical protein